MIEVSISNLRSDISTLNEMIDELEEIKINLFNQLGDSCINWYDGNSLIFNDKIILDSREADEIINTLKEKRDVYDFVCFKYSEIGDKIKCILDNEESLISEISACISGCDGVKGSLSGVHVDVTPAINDIEMAKEELCDFKELIIEVLERIREFEQAINEKISALQLVKITELDFDIDTEVGE